VVEVDLKIRSATSAAVLVISLVTAVSKTIVVISVTKWAILPRIVTRRLTKEKVPATTVARWVISSVSAHRLAIAAATDAMHPATWPVTVLKKWMTIASATTVARLVTSPRTVLRVVNGMPIVTGVETLDILPETVPTTARVSTATAAKI